MLVSGSVWQTLHLQLRVVVLSTSDRTIDFSIVLTVFFHFSWGKFFPWDFSKKGTWAVGRHSNSLDILKSWNWMDQDIIYMKISFSRMLFERIQPYPLWCARYRSVSFVIRWGVPRTWGVPKKNRGASDILMRYQRIRMVPFPVCLARRGLEVPMKSQQEKGASKREKLTIVMHTKRRT